MGNKTDMGPWGQILDPLSTCWARETSKEESTWKKITDLKLSIKSVRTCDKHVKIKSKYEDAAQGRPYIGDAPMD